MKKPVSIVAVHTHTHTTLNRAYFSCLKLNINNRAKEWLYYM